MRLSLSASLALAASTVVQAQADATIPGLSPEFRAKSAFAEFTARQGGQWVAQWNPATITPHTIYGTGIDLPDWRENTLQEARRHAVQALRDHAAMLGLGTSEFRESIGARMGRSWSFTFDQYFQGVPVVGGRADVRVNMIGRIGMLGSTAFPIPAGFDTTPKLGVELATALAWRALGKEPTGVPQPGTPGDPRLVIWGDVDAQDLAPFALAWEVPISNVDRNGDGPIGRYYIDAGTGAVLHYRSDKHECGFTSCNVGHPKAAQPVVPAAPAVAALPIPTTVTVLGWTRTGNDAYSALTNAPLPGLEIAVPGVGTMVTDQNGQFTIDIAAPVTITVGALDGVHHRPLVGANAPTASVTVSPGVNDTIQLLTSAATTNEAAHTTTSYWVDRTNAWLRSIVGNSTQMATISNILPTVNIASTCNAYYTNNTINFYQAGGGCANTAFSTVISHEWGHGIDDRYGGISNSTGDGLSEGWGDIIGMYLVDSPLLGSGFQTANVALRRGDNTLLYPQTGAGVHTAGQVWMGFAWQLRQQLRTAFGTAQAIAISDDIVISSVVANATNQPNAVTQVFVADDDDGNLLNGTPHYTQLRAAALAKNLPYPEQQVVSITHAPLANTSRRLEPRMVNVVAAPVTAGVVTDVRLNYSVNGGANQVRSMKPNGGVNGYRALLPGIVNGSTSYYIEAVHNGTTTVRLPATGSYTYTTSFPPTGAFQGFWLENFESGTNGWTTGTYSGLGNDWQLGVPAGKSGTVSGVPWIDPSSANSTGNVYATDLGIGTSNGRHPNNISYWLRSPAINCSGRTGCYLRFRRWLSVEQSFYDQAGIYVNGTLVWQNPNSNLLDTSWQTVEYAIPMADNNSAVTIEFRLTTDAGLNLGGWQIDNVEVGTRFIPPLAAELRMTPEQATPATQIAIAVRTEGAVTPFYLVIGDSAGPTLFPGVPPILVGGSYIALPAVSDANGAYASTFGAPTPPNALGILWYSQVVTLDASLNNIVVSNQFLNLFTQ
ncbi:MAG: hypothetical protein JNK49_03460 [Planctomycetes bacterium]|nr:hypothetical protein [Planctomycetota bacterium]